MQNNFIKKTKFKLMHNEYLSQHSEYKILLAKTKDLIESNIEDESDIVEKIDDLCKSIEEILLKCKHNRMNKELDQEMRRFII